MSDYAINLPDVPADSELHAFSDGGRWHTAIQVGGKWAATCGRPMRRKWGYAMYQPSVAGGGERCAHCRWDAPPQFMHRHSEAELAYLECFIEDERSAAAWLAAERGKPGYSGRASTARSHIERTALAWGWGIESVEGRRAMAHQVALAAASLGDGDDEMRDACDALAHSAREVEDCRVDYREACVRLAKAKELMDADHKRVGDLAFELELKIARGR